MNAAVIAALCLLVLSACLFVILATAVLGRKALRDRREVRSHGRRAEYARLLGSGEEDALEAALRLVRDRGAELDLLGALDGSPAAPERLGPAARASGLLDRLARRLRSSDPGERGRAALLLGRLDPDAAEGLRGMLRDPDPDVRLVACAALTSARDPEAVTWLLDAVADGRLASERVIERVGARWAVGALLAAGAQAPGGSEVRLACARALGVAGDPRGAGALLALLRDGNEEERISAARALAGVGFAGARPELARALEDVSWELRAQAAKTLGVVGCPEDVPALEARLADRAWWVRANAAAALVELGAEGRAALERAAHGDDAYARDRAREALALAAVGSAA